MAQATAQVRRAIGNGASYLAVAAAAAILVVTTILVVGRVPASVETPANDAQVVSPALRNSEREWERQRLQQSGLYADPARESAREWERQRLQQSGAYVDPARESAREWERQRLQQSGASK